MNGRTSLLLLILASLFTVQTPAFSQEILNPEAIDNSETVLSTASASAIESRHDVIIVGGGWSGFTAAYYLKDFDVKVLERNSRPGWSVWTELYEEFPYESDSEEPSPLSKMIDLLGLKIRKVPSPLQAYFHNNQFYYGPSGLAALLTAQSSEAEFNRFAALLNGIMDEYRDLPQFDTQLPLTELDNISAEQWIKDNQFQSYSDLFNVICRRYFGSNVSEVSALSLLVKIGKVFMNDVNAYTLTDEYAVPKAIADSFGGVIEGDVDVTEVAKLGSLYTVVYEDQTKQRHIATARVVILSVDPQEAIQLASNALSREQTELLQSIPYRSEITLQIYSGPPIFNKAFNFTPPDNAVYTAVYDDQWFDRNADPNYTAEMNSATFILSPQSNHDLDFLSLGQYDTDEEMMTKFFLPFLQGLPPILPTLQEMGPQGAMGYVIYHKSDIEPILPVGAYHRLKQLHDSIQNGLIPAGDYMIYPGFEGKVNSGYWAAQKAREFLGQASGILQYEGYR